MAKRRGALSVDPVAEATHQWATHGYDAGPRLQASLSLIRVESIVRERNAEVLNEYGLSYGQHEVLMLLSFTKTGELPLGKIGERLMVHPTSVSNSVDALAALDMAERRDDPRDRRTRLARITRRGRHIARKTAASLSAAQFGLGELDEAEASELFRILLKLRAQDFQHAAGEPATNGKATARRSEKVAQR